MKKKFIFSKGKMINRLIREGRIYSLPVEFFDIMKNLDGQVAIPNPMKQNEDANNIIYVCIGKDGSLIDVNKCDCVEERENLEVSYLKEIYLPGTKLECLQMEDIQAVPKGTIGTVTSVDDMGTIHVAWENGSSLGLVITEDKFRIVD